MRRYDEDIVVASRQTRAFCTSASMRRWGRRWRIHSRYRLKPDNAWLAQIRVTLTGRAERPRALLFADFAVMVEAQRDPSIKLLHVTSGLCLSLPNTLSSALVLEYSGLQTFIEIYAVGVAAS